MAWTASPRAVVIEDDRDIALRVGEDLEQEGSSVTTVHEGVDGRAKALDR